MWRYRIAVEGRGPYRSSNRGGRREGSIHESIETRGDGRVGRSQAVEAGSSCNRLRPVGQEYTSARVSHDTPNDDSRTKSVLRVHAAPGRSTDRGDIARRRPDRVVRGLRGSRRRGPLLLSRKSREPVRGLVLRPPSQDPRLPRNRPGSARNGVERLRPGLRFSDTPPTSPRLRMRSASSASVSSDSRAAGRPRSRVRVRWHTASRRSDWSAVGHLSVSSRIWPLDSHRSTERTCNSRG